MAPSLIGNLLVVAVFYRNKTLRTAVHYFKVNMAISDLIVLLIYLPWIVIYVSRNRLWFVDGVLGTVLCKLFYITWGLSTCVSILSMMGTAADRFYAVLFPMKSTLFSRNKRRLIIAATWVASVALRAHYLYGAKLILDGSNLHCKLQWKPASYTRKIVLINWILYFCLTSVFATMLTVLYSSITFFLYRQRNNFHLATKVMRLRATESRQILTRMLVIIVVAFM